MLPLLTLDRALIERLLKLDARYVDELGRVTREFLRDTGAAVGDSLRAREEGGPRPTSTVPLPPPAKPPGGTIVLEEEAGKIASDVFLVQNNQNNEITVRPEVSPFLDPPAPGVSANISFDPKEIKLPPQTQISVRIMSFIDPNLQLDVLYKCELTVPALGAAKTPVIIRRRATTISGM
jgi:hypothetical protein